MLRLLLVLLLLPVLAVGTLLTPWGTSWGLGVAAGFVPGLRVEGIAGRLPARLAVERLSLSDEQGAWLEVEGAELRLAWRELLSWRLRLEAVTAQRIALHRLPPAAPSEPAPLAVPQLPHLPLPIRIERLDLTRLELGEPLLGQEAALSLRGDLALEAARLTAALALERLDAPGRATVALGLDGRQLSARIAASEPPGGLVATLAGLPGAPFRLDLTLDGPAAGAAWSLDATLGEAGARFSGEASLTPAGEIALTLAGTASPAGLLPAEFAPLAATLRLDGALTRAADGALALPRLALAAPAGEVQAEGRLGADERLAASFRLTIAPPTTFATWLPDGLGWRALGAEGRVTGTLAAPALDMTLHMEGPAGLGQADAWLGETLHLQAAITPARLDAQLTGERLTARVAGPIQAPLDVSFSLTAQDPPGLGGAIAAQGRITGTPEAPRIQAQLAADRLEAEGQALEAVRLALEASLTAARVTAEGRFQDRPLSLDLEARRDGDALRLERLEARFADATLTGRAQGNLPAGPFSGDIRLGAPDLAQWGLGLVGRLDAELSATAQPDAGGWAAQGIRLRLEGTGLGTPAFRADLQAEADGSLDALGFRLGVTAPQGGLNLAGEMALAGETARIALNRLEARTGQDALTLAAPTRLTITRAGDVALESARLASRRGGALSLQGGLQGGQIQGRAEMSALPLAAYSEGAVTGTASAQATASGSLAAPQVEATLRAEALRAPQAPQLPPGQLTATARLQGEALRAEARLTAGPAVQLDLTAQQPRGVGPARPFEAALRGRLDL
ncbi:hypothetical protein KTR66_22105, partial [Roseococcus sp. SDR]|uniref:hypothetical protein n=1 Tax=Roseococcus sp. SDR TaxID=2835532 RepID=UPI001BCCA85D